MNYITKEGLKKLRNKLIYLESSERKRITQQIADARDKGDLSENAEYDAAKEEQVLLEMQISNLKNKINNAKIINPNMLDSKKIGILSTVKLKNLINHQILQYTFVPETDINLKVGKISVNTPIAQGLMGKTVGEKAKINLPTGDTLYLEIIQINISN